MCISLQFTHFLVKLDVLLHQSYTEEPLHFIQLTARTVLQHQAPRRWLQLKSVSIPMITHPPTFDVSIDVWTLTWQQCALFRDKILRTLKVSEKKPGNIRKSGVRCWEEKGSLSALHSSLLCGEGLTHWTFDWLLHSSSYSFHLVGPGQALSCWTTARNTKVLCLASWSKTTQSWRKKLFCSGYRTCRQLLKVQRCVII